MVLVRNGKVIINFIVGIRKRGEILEIDSVLEKELMEDKKEFVEYVMFVDFGRNDIGKVSKIGIVNVNEFMKVEKFFYVMYIIIKVVGEIEDDKDGFDVLVVCLFVGIVLGVFKIRVMEIIEKLEDCKRGIYFGVVGYFLYGGDMDMVIVIRIFLLKDKIVIL